MFNSTKERINYLKYICESLEDTTSLNEKREIVSSIASECKDDFNFILEILANKHPLGYKYNPMNVLPCKNDDSNLTLREYLEPLWQPKKEADLSVANCNIAMRKVNICRHFIASIVNRTLRLGIGSSLLDKTDTSPMLAKKFEGTLDFDPLGYYITEKLDGNRCIAKFINGKWTFWSRNGKPMNVNFDMRNFNTDFVYDGEVMTRQQTDRSKKLWEDVCFPTHSISPENKISTEYFRAASGLINQHTLNKDLVYNVFDIADTSAKYNERRQFLDTIIDGNDTRIVPVLQTCTKNNTDGINKLLDFVTSQGAEGLMINAASAKYQHKRTGSLLKYKQVQTMDMKVIDWEYGTGKYENMVGYLVCELVTSDCKFITCKVGSGFTDDQRLSWALKPNLIINKIVEIAYFSLSQNKTTDGTTIYSLRFPRMKSIRENKIKTSEY